MLEEYNKAYKLGKKDYQARLSERRNVPLLRSCDEILPARGILFRMFFGTGTDSYRSDCWNEDRRKEQCICR